MSSKSEAITDAKPVHNGTGIAIIAALFCFSAGPVGIVVQKWLVESFSPFLIIAIQMVVGAVVLWVIRFAFFPKTSVPRLSILKGLALGIMHPGGFMITYTAATGRLDSVTAVFLLALVPSLIAIGGRIFLKEQLPPTVLIGIIVSLIGLIVLVSERQATGESEPLGFVLGILGLTLASGGG